MYFLFNYVYVYAYGRGCELNIGILRKLEEEVGSSEANMMTSSEPSDKGGSQAQVLSKSSTHS